MTQREFFEKQKHLRDIRGVLAVSGQALDMGYIEKWVRTLGLQAEWERAKSAPRE